MGALLTLMAEWALAALAPPRCAACDAPVPLLTAFCADCAGSIQRATPSDDSSGVAAFAYGGPLARAIGRFKYEGRPDLARPLADLLWRAVEPHRRRLAGALVVPVPLHPMRLADRGYNQSALLAARLSRRLRAPFAPLALARTRDSPRQATLDRKAREENVRSAFAVRGQGRIHGRSVLLVDDVWTTGATLEACEGALRRAGATRVSYAVVARA